MRKSDYTLNMLFRKRQKTNLYARYGRRPILTSTSGKRLMRGKKTIIENISFPSLGTVKKILINLIGLTLISAGGYAVFLSPYFKVSKIFIQYEEFQDENEELLENFSDFKGKNILFIEPEKRIEKMKKQNPELEKLSVQKILPNTIKISFSKFPIIANIEKIVNGKLIEKMLINSKGMVIYRDTENPNLPYIKIFTKEKIEPVPIEQSIPEQSAKESSPIQHSLLPNEPAIPGEYLNYTLAAEQNFIERFGMKVFETRFYPQARELHLKTEKNFLIWLDMQTPYERQFLKLKKAMSILAIHTQPLEYVDLRVSGTNGEKVIFKRKK